MKTEKQFEQWIRKCIDKYTPILNIENQIIEIEKSKDYQYLAIKLVYPYLDPTIYWGDKAFMDWKSGKMREDRILHELCHILTDPLYCKAQARYIGKDEIEDERERLTDTITSIIRKLL